MHLIEIFLPLNDNSGRPFGTEKYAMVRERLTERFDGLTAYSRSRAQGTTSDGGKTVHAADHDRLKIRHAYRCLN